MSTLISLGFLHDVRFWVRLGFRLLIVPFEALRVMLFFPIVI